MPVSKKSRASKKTSEALHGHRSPPQQQLSRRAMNVLMKGRYARLGGAAPRKRAVNLTKIAMAYSQAELLAEAGVGEVTVAEIQQWLSLQGYSLSRSP